MSSFLVLSSFSVRFCVGVCVCIVFSFLFLLFLGLLLIRLLLIIIGRRWIIRLLIHLLLLSRSLLLDYMLFNDRSVGCRGVIFIFGRFFIICLIFDIFCLFELALIFGV